MNELERLDALVDQFAAAMKEKLHKKHAEGYRGWEDCDEIDWKQSLRGHVDKGDPVDAGNFAAFWWYSVGRPGKRP